MAESLGISIGNNEQDCLCVNSNQKTLLRFVQFLVFLNRELNSIRKDRLDQKNLPCNKQYAFDQPAACEVLPYEDTQ